MGDALWAHPDTGAIFYVGGAGAAKSRVLLEKYRITRIVNCQDTDGKNYFEGDPELTYFQFNLGLWRQVAGVTDGGDGTWRYWEPYFAFVFESLASGQNVLVHCLAGAHRAGTAGIAMLMLLMGWDWQKSVEAAKQLRPAISPI